MQLELPSPSDEPLDSASGGKSREDLEVAIGEIWKEVFQREEIDRDDNFFELGGNSLLGMDLTELLATRLDIHLPVLMLFQYPTIREMSEIICAGGELP
jgi:acyl carrier protein